MSNEPIVRVISEADDAARPPDQDTVSGIPSVRVRKLISGPDPDQVMLGNLEWLDTKVINLNVRLLERGQDRKFHEAYYPNLTAYVKSPTFQRRVRAAGRIAQLREASESLRESAEKSLREHDTFSMGTYPDEVTGTNKPLFPLQENFLPGMSSPASKQMLFVDYQGMHVKSWEAATRNPIGKRIVKLVPQFVLGRGVAGSCKDEAKQREWDSFWHRNRMRLRLKQQLRELLIYGEIFNRFYKRPEGLVIRNMDPITIWDIVTNPDDIEEVYYYHQQYVILNQSPIPGRTGSPSTLVIRQVPAADVDHFAINRTSSEKRGRSELYVILGWLQRFKEFVNDRVLVNKMRTMFALDVTVEGGKTEVDAAEAQFGTPPGPAAALVHNKAVTIDFKSTTTNATDASTDAELLLKIIAIGAGVSEQFLGVSKQTSRASALISTEPDVKNFEDYQEIVEEMLIRMSERVFLGKKVGLQSQRTTIEFSFPSLASEDRSAKIKDLAFMESMDWITKKRAASMAAKETNITTYDYEKEQDEIRKEGETLPLISQTMVQVPKFSDPNADPNAQGMDAAAQDMAPEDADPFANLDPEQMSEIVSMAGEMGYKGDKGSGRSLPSTPASLDRSSFTHGSEKEAIKGSKSTGKKTKESGRGWTVEARQAAVLSRQRKAEARKREQLNAS